MIRFNINHLDYEPADINVHPFSHKIDSGLSTTISHKCFSIEQNKIL